MPLPVLVLLSVGASMAVRAMITSAVRWAARKIVVAIVTDMIASRVSDMLINEDIGREDLWDILTDPYPIRLIDMNTGKTRDFGKTAATAIRLRKLLNNSGLTSGAMVPGMSKLIHAQWTKIFDVDHPILGKAAVLASRYAASDPKVELIELKEEPQDYKDVSYYENSVAKAVLGTGQLDQEASITYNERIGRTADGNELSPIALAISFQNPDIVREVAGEYVQDLRNKGRTSEILTFKADPSSG